MGRRPKWVIPVEGVPCLTYQDVSDINKDIVSTAYVYSIMSGNWFLMKPNEEYETLRYDLPEDMNRIPKEIITKLLLLKG